MNHEKTGLLLISFNIRVAAATSTLRPQMTGLLSFLLKLINWFRLQDSFLATTKRREKEENKKGQNKGSGYLARYSKLCSKYRWTDSSHCYHLGSAKLGTISKANFFFNPLHVCSFGRFLQQAISFCKGTNNRVFSSCKSVILHLIM